MASPRCPTCRTACIPVHYGPLTRRVVEQARRGEIRLGGRIPIGRGWWCPECEVPVLGPGEAGGWAAWR